jgi:hypothetical protein
MVSDFFKVIDGRKEEPEANQAHEQQNDSHHKRPAL